MSDEKRETIEDILAEIRRLSGLTTDGIIAINGLVIADRIESAVMHEVSRRDAETQSGNAAAMREALESARNWCLNRLCNASYQVTVEGLLSVVNAALSAPPRNCDVGTPEEGEGK